MSGYFYDSPLRATFIVHGAEAVAPAAAAVLADSGPIGGPVNSANQIRLRVVIAGQDSLVDYEVAHRDVANENDLEVAMIPAALMPGDWSGLFHSPNQGERFVVRARSAGTSDKTYQVSLYGIIE